ALTEQLHQTDIDNYAEWVMRLGAEGDDSGESPLGASLRGIIALESHGARPGELIFSHGMLNRYMDAIATTVDWQDRKRLQQLLEDPAIPELARNVAAIQALKELGVKDFETYDKNNYQANGGFIEYTVDSGPGLWIPGRRIEPQKPGTNPAYIELHHNAETSRWEQ
ncbi:MAG TPA: hypothetical protein VFB59_01630, partial [Candidatus Saccharimonadales bacterium]|nr:hypothetical protein [Candidatus Saccharimonadales bacterium]